MMIKRQIQSVDCRVSTSMGLLVLSLTVRRISFEPRAAPTLNPAAVSTRLRA
jgi:hypothetical protein